MAHLSKSVVNFSLIMMSKPKYIDYFNGSFFCSVVAGGTSHFYSFFRKFLARVDFFGMTTLAFGLPRPKTNRRWVFKFHLWILHGKYLLIFYRGMPFYFFFFLFMSMRVNCLINVGGGFCQILMKLWPLFEVGIFLASEPLDQRSRTLA